jgi:hypothetical protein
VGIKSRRLFDLIMFQSLYRRTLVTQIFSDTGYESMSRLDSNLIPINVCIGIMICINIVTHIVLTYDVYTPVHVLDLHAVCGSPGAG